MADLSNLFSASSPSPPRASTSKEALFLSPSDTPDRPIYQPSLPDLPSPPWAPVFRRQEVNTLREEISDGRGAGLAEGSRGSGGGRVGGGGIANGAEMYGYDPLDLSAAFGEDGIRGDADDEPAGKKRRVMAKVDVDRLMGEKGFPALMKSAKRFRPRGKGNEDKDLRDILNVYQLWAHGMFPKGDFEGTIKRVETICRTRRMEIAMKGYRDAFYPPASPIAASPGSPASLHAGDEQGEERERNEGHGEEGAEQDDTFGRPDLDQAHDPRRDSSAPLFDLADDDGPDMDELIAMEEMERSGGQSTDEREAAREEEQRVVRQARLKAFEEGSRGGDEARERTNSVGRGDDAPPPLEEEDEWEGLYD